MNYVIGYEKNQRNCYMALYELAEAKATVEAEDFSLGEVSNRKTLLCPPGDSDDDPPVISEAAASDDNFLFLRDSADDPLHAICIKPSDDESGESDVEEFETLKTTPVGPDKPTIVIRDKA